MEQLGNLKDLIQDLKNIRIDLVKEMPNLAYELASDGLAYIETRWIDEGKDSSGGKQLYSSKKFNAGIMFRRTEGKGKGGRKNPSFSQSTYDELYKKAKKGEEVNYKDIRGIEGLQTSHKDFRVTGKLWKSIQVKQITKNGLDFEFEIDSVSERGREILKHTKEGKQNLLILEFTKEEVDILQEDLIAIANKIIKRHLK